jgi:Raf kinase inhibitor-like YbhB/YbcL family protein
MKTGKKLLLLASVVVVFGFSERFLSSCKTDKMKTDLTVTSSAFADSAMIPSKYTCDAENISPAISWSKGPDNTKTYALICDDPDAPSKVWVHWVLFNIPASITSISENQPTDKTILSSAINGNNDFGTLGYSGPCPPRGIHHYCFKVYALDCSVSLSAGATKDEVVSAMKDHILAEGQLTGRYQRQK